MFFFVKSKIKNKIKLFTICPFSGCNIALGIRLAAVRGESWPKRRFRGASFNQHPLNSWLCPNFYVIIVAKRDDDSTAEIQK